jgi:hypothetical protein
MDITEEMIEEMKAPEFKKFVKEVYDFSYDLSNFLDETQPSAAIFYTSLHSLLNQWHKRDPEVVKEFASTIYMDFCSTSTKN